MYSPFRHFDSILLKRRPIHLTYFVTKRCNGRCPFCFSGSPENGGAGHDELTLAEVRQFSRSLGSLLWLAFSGGEIFLRQDLPEISRTFYRQNRPAIMLFPTNGLLPELIHSRMEEILTDCPESIVTVKLSLDGVGSDHDAVRNLQGSFEKTLQTHALLSGLSSRFRNFELGVNTVFCAGNQDRMDSIIDFVSSMEGVRTHTISLVRGELTDPAHKDVDLTRYRRAVDRLAENLRQGTAAVYRFWGGRLKAAQDVLQRRTILRTADEGRMIIPCYAGKLNIVLDARGELYPCEMLTETLGNIREFGYDALKVLQRPDALRRVGRITKERCHCTHECYAMTNILFNPRCYPALLKEYLSISSGSR